MLDRATARLNAGGIFLYRKKTKSFLLSDSDFANGDSTLDLPADFAWPVDPFSLYDSAGNLIHMVEWAAWEKFIGAKSTLSTTSIPSFASLRSETDSALQIWPSIKTDQISRIDVTYFARVQKPSQVLNAEISMTPETQEALITGGQALIMQYRYKDRPQIWRFWAEEANVQFRKAKSAAHRLQQSFHMQATPDEAGRYGNSPFFPAGGATAFIGL
jgi:hypothetical protein